MGAAGAQDADAEPTAAEMFEGGMKLYLEGQYSKAKELLLTGDTIDAHEATRLGLINKVVPHEELMDTCLKTAMKITRISRVGIKMTKIAVNRALEGMGFLSTLGHNLELMTHFDTSTSPEQEEFNRVRRESGLRAAMNWRDARFEGL